MHIHTCTHTFVFMYIMQMFLNHEFIMQSIYLMYFASCSCSQGGLDGGESWSYPDGVHWGLRLSSLVCIIIINDLLIKSNITFVAEYIYLLLSCLSHYPCLGHRHFHPTSRSLSHHRCQCAGERRSQRIWSFEPWPIEGTRVVTTRQSAISGQLLFDRS